MVAQFPRFLVIIGVVTIVPGPDTVLVMRNAIRGGRACGLATAAGCALGLMVWASAASVGTAVLLSHFAQIAGAVRLAGAVYLLAIGGILVRTGWRRLTTVHPPVSEYAPFGDQGATVRRRHPQQSQLSRGGLRRAVFQGLAADLLNPKAAFFFTALLPQFVAVGNTVDMMVTTIALGAIAAAAALAGLTAYAVLASTTRASAHPPWLPAVLDVVAGLALLAFGVDLLRQHLGRHLAPSVSPSGLGRGVF